MKCIVCGKEFKTQLNKKTCSPECSREHRLAWQREWFKNDRQKKKQSPCAGCIYYGSLSTCSGGSAGICGYAIKTNDVRLIPIEDCASGREGSKRVDK